MKITRENYKDFVPDKVLALFDDLDEINNYTEDNLYIDWQDYHNEYSCERTDPCPDFYGCYTIRFEQQPYETIGGEMTINDLENALCVLYDFNKLQHYSR